MRNALILAALVVAAACSGTDAPLVASDVVIKKPMPGMHMSAGYFTLTNNGDEPLTITHVSSPQFEAVEMHETIVEDGISRMKPLGDLAIPPSSSVVFEPGGKHLMLMRPRDDLETVSLAIHTGDAIVLTINVTPEG